ncbi:trans-sulfuration enzyme family protein [Agrobacterium salinitolerans]|uniref:trans-sulfuration enzyme family protein n=1 Tax=Agrobacterium salinitolerans TaxID=1183413 RepID=UPI0022B83867|nr:aminotransferase class V-fold PLP-dependent enzyme [Agrobacterium salinitolerans]MCZ7888931.1 aminotransferase class V-fold PLP-dependent enzyme [Agrobacterium salinitolerans]
MTNKATLLAQSGLFPIGPARLPAPAIINATTVIARNAASLAKLSGENLARTDKGIYDNFIYGGVGTPTTAALAVTVAALEGANYTVLTPSGQSAIVAVLSGLLKTGDHILVADTATFSSKWYLDHVIARSGIAVSYYPPGIGGNISDYIRPETQAIFMESPGSFTFEVEDIPAVVCAAKAQNVLAILDNTWSASTHFDAFKHGIDIVVLSLTKCHAGPAGVSLGAIATRNHELYARFRNEAALLGLNVSPDACAHASLALSTLHIRLKHQAETTLKVLEALKSRPEILRIFHPSLPRNFGYNIWKRDFSGFCSMFSISFDGWTKDDVEALMDCFRVIKIGYGWGGLISLSSHFEADEWRTVSNSGAQGTCLRLYIGLEDAEDICADLIQALDHVLRRRHGSEISVAANRLVPEHTS